MTETAQRGRVKVEQGLKRVRCLFDGEVVADTRTPWLVWELPYYPAYYVPLDDVRAELVETGETDGSPSRGKAVLYDVKVGAAVAPSSARRYSESPIPELRSLVRFDWGAMDEWLEEDEPVYVHPRSPYSRVDVLTSSRLIRVVIDGVTVAESDRPHILFETGLPPRYYLPLPHVRLDLLRPSDTVSRCPYKGEATYWSMEINGTTYNDAVWTYRYPLPESQKIAGLVCFYNERVDLYVDGELQARPRTPFS
jgi:uncharacterized protein (DUF427 family)